jgi:hypothetical protein
MLLRVERINTVTQKDKYCNTKPIRVMLSVPQFALMHTSTSPSYDSLPLHSHVTPQTLIIARFLILTLAQELISSIRSLQSDYSVLNYMTNAHLLLQPPPVADSSLTNIASSPRPRPSPVTHIPVTTIIMETGVTHSMTRVNGVTSGP